MCLALLLQLSKTAGNLGSGFSFFVTESPLFFNPIYKNSHFPQFKSHFLEVKSHFLQVKYQFGGVKYQFGDVKYQFVGVKKLLIFRSEFVGLFKL